MSEFVTEAVHEKIDREDTAEVAHQYRLEERLLGLVDDAADEAADQITARVLEALEARGQLAPEDPDSNDTEGGGEIIDFS